MTHGATLGGHVVKAALERAQVAADEVSDVLMGCAFPEGATGWNIGRQIALRAGLPASVPGLTVNRFCSSGLQTIAFEGRGKHEPAKHAPDTVPGARVTGAGACTSSSKGKDGVDLTRLMLISA